MAGDRLAFKIQGPAGPFVDAEIEIPETQPFRLEAVGRRAGAQGLQPGTYTGTAIHSRAGRELGRRTARAILP